MKNTNANPRTVFNRDSVAPSVHESAYVHPRACLIGDVIVGSHVMIAPLASIRADEGAPFHIGANSNVQDGAVIHALDSSGEREADNTYDVHGKRYSVYVGERVSIAHQCQIHGPALVEDDCFVGMQAFVFKSRIGRGSVIEPCARVMGVEVPAGRYVSAGRVLCSQSEADDLPLIDERYPMRALNMEVVRVNTELARAYRAQGGVLMR